MIEKLQDNDLVITNKYLKNKLIEESSKKLINVKIVTLDEFKKMYFGYYDERSIYYLINKYNYKYDVACLKLSNVNFIEDLKKELIDNKLFINPSINMNLYKRVVLCTENVDNYVENVLKNYNLIKIETKMRSYQQNVHKFDEIDDEINFVATKIVDMLENIDINFINLVNVTSEYINPIKRIFKSYNIPINLNEKTSIYSTNIVQNFLRRLDNSDDIEDIINDLADDDVSNKIVEVLNKYRFISVDKTIKYIIREELKRACINSSKLENAVNVCDISEIDDSRYYFILGFNEGNIPKVYKDDDYFSDIKKEKLGILTSLEKNKYERDLVISKISNCKNLIITYKLNTPFQSYLPSRLIEDLGLDIIEDNNINYNYSNDYNKILLSKKLDDLIKFNKIDRDLDILYSNYRNIEYKSYDNKYTSINKELFKKYINNKLLLSYSSLDNYNRCGFRYYISNILKLDKYQETFMTYIGSLFHEILSVCYKESFNFEDSFNALIVGKEFTNKELFFINKLKNDLKSIIKIIKDQDKYSSLNETLYEQKIYIDKSRDIKVTFMGIIDKLKYKNQNNKTIIAIIDYKTGNPAINIDNSIYGLEMQLPIYLYLARNYKLNNVVVGGFYLQKILPNKLNYEKGKNVLDEQKKLYKLEGYSNSNIEVLQCVDNSYENSNIIKSMSTTSKGFSSYSKILNQEEIDNLYNLVDRNIDKDIDNILNVKFDINPKKVGDKLEGCEYCKFKDLCYLKNEDIVNLDNISYKKFLGSDNNASLD